MSHDIFEYPEEFKNQDFELEPVYNFVQDPSVLRDSILKININRRSVNEDLCKDWVILDGFHLFKDSQVFFNKTSFEALQFNDKKFVSRYNFLTGRKISSDKSDFPMEFFDKFDLSFENTDDSGCSIQFLHDFYNNFPESPQYQEEEEDNEKIDRF